MLKNSTIDVTNHPTIIIPEDCIMENMSKDDVEKYQSQIVNTLDDKIRFITTHQSVPEWFLCKMITLTASPAEQHIQIGMSNAAWKQKDKWKLLKIYQMMCKTQEYTETAIDCITLETVTNKVHRLYEDFNET